MVEDTPDIFFIQRPVKKDKTYNEFLSYLYRNDKAKSKVKREIQSAETVNNDVARNKRAIIFRWASSTRHDIMNANQHIIVVYFRPLFVYKQQEIKRQRVVEDKKKNTKKPIKPTKKSQG